MTVRNALAFAVVAGSLLMTSAACSSDGDSDETTRATPSVAVPTSANVALPAGPLALTDPGEALLWSDTALLPSDAFRPDQQLAGFTVTGIEPAPGGALPDSFTHGGSPFYIHLTVTQAVDRQRNALSTAGFAGSADGVTPALTLTPPPNVAGCQAGPPPQTLAKGQSYATCLVALADPDTTLTRVIYWADTGDDRYDYKSAPVVWSDGTAPAAPSSSTQPTG
ncbi:hypothetical protein DFR67_103269 [Williamsia limnetica]|jgi:hypothetical protein|uniref:Lipoprotein n=1 Tax=Williamsia limnetica TaxID=882452 RepID=A0A318RTF2_WILLI|nr:hypothetical protein [Williamsia limnetica]PYE19357.1 hypothetical protein DFR67_103269 [Williamsia limnetica]